MAKRKQTKQSLRTKAAANKAGSLVASGVAKADLTRLSTRTLNSALSKTKRNTAKGRAIATEIARRNPRKK